MPVTLTDLEAMLVQIESDLAVAQEREQAAQLRYRQQSRTHRKLRDTRDNLHALIESWRRHNDVNAPPAGEEAEEEEIPF